MADVMTWDQREELKSLYLWGIAHRKGGFKKACPGMVNLLHNDFATCSLPAGHDGDHYESRAGHWHVSN